MVRLVLSLVFVCLSVLPAYAINLKLPFRSGEAWVVTTQYGGYCGTGCQDNYHTDANNGYYAIDFDKPGAPEGSGLPILAVADGTVEFAGGNPSTGFGYYVKLDHGGGYKSLYGHLKELPTVSGTIHQGQQIGKLGSTGNSTADHLHFQLYYNGNCKSNVPQSKPEPMSGYTNFVYGQTYTSDNAPTSLFTAAYNRNGGSATVGSASGAIYSYGPFERQDYSGGSFGNCCIMYDPDNMNGNPLATNEAYLLRTGFYNYYQANGNYSAFGCPTRDEYVTGDGTNAIQFFVRRVGSETQQHYMYFDPTPPPEDQGHTVTWHSTYTTAYNSQTPSSQTNVVRGATRTFTVKFQNTGQFTWHNNSTSYPYDYVQLKSCDASGVVCNSYLGSPGWIDVQTPCTMVESSVAPGQVATFTFLGKVASNASLGSIGVYFRPIHSVGGLMDNWGGMYFPVNVVRKTALDFDGDGISDIWDRTASGLFRIDYAYNNLNGWDVQYGGYGGSVDTPCPADYDGDGKCDFAILRSSDRVWFIDYAANGFGAWDVSYGGYGDTYDYPCSADYDGDGKADISVRDADGDWHIDYAANGFGAWDWTGYGYGGQYDRPAPADYDGDGKCDFAVLRDSDRKWLIDYAANGFGAWDVTNLAGYGGFTDYPCPADYDGDGKADIAVLWTGDGTFRIDWSSNSFGGWAYILSGYGSAGDRPLVGDYDGDGRDDIGIYTPSVNRVCFDMWNYQGVTGWNGWDYCDAGGLHPSYNVQPAPPDEGTLPTQFSLSLKPNPSTTATTINFALPLADKVRITIYDVSGREVNQVPERTYDPGRYSVTWNHTSQSGERLVNGIYFVRFTSHLHTVTTKVVIVK